jgi:hypothetical protein
MVCNISQRLITSGNIGSAKGVVRQGAASGGRMRRLSVDLLTSRRIRPFRAIADRFPVTVRNAYLQLKVSVILSRFWRRTSGQWRRLHTMSWLFLDNPR